jgi:hypothetical protein
MKKALLIILMCISLILFIPLFFVCIDVLFVHGFDKSGIILAAVFGFKIDLLILTVVIISIAINKLNELIYKILD